MWNQLSEDQWAEFVVNLKKHLRYDSYLAAHKPNGFTEDERVFMQAGTWADWVRGRREFDHPTWHYINYLIVRPGSAVKAADHEPPGGKLGGLRPGDSVRRLFA